MSKAEKDAVADLVEALRGAVFDLGCAARWIDNEKTTAYLKAKAEKYLAVIAKATGESA